MTTPETIIGTCPACHAESSFYAIGHQEDPDGPGFWLWNCEEGHTVSTDSIVAASLEVSRE